MRPRQRGHIRIQPRSTPWHLHHEDPMPNEVLYLAGETIDGAYLRPGVLPYIDNLWNNYSRGDRAALIYGHGLAACQVEPLKELLFRHGPGPLRIAM
ncbi:hypothetical protein PC120_g22045 [Phytophthora cactorum]|nr:hypothetical protein PC120_g22045 [Phytophthora cactorum]